MSTSIREALPQQEVTVMDSQTPAPTTSPDAVDLSGSWSDFWTKATSDGGLGQILHLLSLVGMLIVVAAVVGVVMSARKPGGAQGAGGAIGGALVVGVLLSAPGLVMPVVLGLVDAVANAAWRVVA